MSATTQVAHGIYRINGSADGDGQPYTVHLHSEGWVILDSRRRPVSLHLTMADAVASVEVAQ